MTPGDEAAARNAVIAAARGMNARRLNRGRSGNASVRWRAAGFDGFLVTPTGMDYEVLVPGDIVALHADGSARDADARIPSSEWRFHRDIYAARADANAIVHAHSPFATTLACLGRDIPSFHYMVAIVGGTDIRCAPYARFGSAELAHVAVAALAGRRACLLANHGMIAVGNEPVAALDLAEQVELLAEMYWRALQIGEPELLTDTEMNAVVEMFATYGQQRRD